uniref:START domain-containing protein n=1 Tax=Magallana gigas TaxID=29159 RepID=A0A8W8IA99_MAGGI
MDFRKIAEGVADRLQKYYKTAEGWTSAKKSKNFEISYRQSEEFSGHLYKGEAIYNCPPKTVFDYVEPLPDGPRAKWDTNMKKIEILKWIETPDLRINRACTASAMLGLISPRDFVDLILVRETDECFSTNAISIEYPECPEVKDHVRGWNWSCGMICVKYPDVELDEFPEEKKYVRGWNYSCGVLVIKFPSDPNKCKLVSLIQPDIKGMLPKNVVESAIPGSMVEFFTKLEEALKKDGKISS